MTPDGWKRRTIGELVEGVTTGVSVNSQGRPREAGEIGVLKTSAVTSGMFRPQENKAILPEEAARAREHPRAGCVLFSRMNTIALVGASAFVDADHDDLVLPDRIWQLRPSTLADGRWLHATLSSARMRSCLSEAASGTSGSMKNLSQEKVLALAVLAPPLQEQRKIAAILTSVDDVIESTRAVIDQLGVVKQAMMAELLPRGVPGRHKRFRMTSFGETAEEWDVLPFGEVTEQLRAPVAVDPDGLYQEIGVRSHGKGLFHKDPVPGKALGNKRVFWVRPGCLVLNIVFAWEGAVGAADDSESGMIASHRFPMFRPIAEVLSLQYLRLLFQTKRGIEILGSVSPGGAGRNRTLNQGALQRVAIPIPPPEEQALIASAIVSVEDRLRMETTFLASMRDLKNGLATAILTGEIRVTPDKSAA